MAQLARSYEHMRREAERGSDDGRALIGFDVAQEGAECIRVDDGRNVVWLDRRQSPAERRGGVTCCAPRRNREAHQLADVGERSVGRLDGASGSNPAHDVEDLGRYEGCDRAMPDPGEDFSIKALLDS